MKKSKKCNLKKLALLGIAGGTVLSTGTAVANTNNFSQLLAFNGCGGQNGCHGSSGNNNGGYQAYRSIPSQNSYYSTEGQGQYSSCSNSSAPQYYQSNASCAAQSNQPSSSCRSYSSHTPNYPSSSCSTAYAPRGETYQPASSQYSSSGTSTTPGQSGYSGTSTAPVQNNPRGTPSTPSSTSSSSGRYLGSASSATQTNSQQPQFNQNHSNQEQSSNPSAWNQRNNSKWENNYTADTEKTNGQKLTESEMVSKLNDQSKATYQSLDSAGKALALKMANQDCKGQNECKGLNSCKNSEHSCAGKGSCKGTAQSNFKDKNLAVKVAALKMAEKRANAASSKY